MTSKHPKQKNPSDADLHRNPLIGGSKGTTMAHVTPEELEQFEGVNTIEGDVENDTNPLGGIDKAKVRNARRGPPDHGREPARALQRAYISARTRRKALEAGV
jgi:hypothetical protein